MKKTTLSLKNNCCVWAILLSVMGWQTAFSQSRNDKHVQLDEVVVTGTGTEHLLKNAPVQTEVISGKTLRHFAGKSIQEMLGMLTSSFDFNEDDMGSQIQMNGLGNNYILILIDGKRIHGDVGGQNDLGLIDPQNIEKIEIVKGASSALYGSDAIAGVVNIITKKHDQEGLLLENTSRIGSYGDIRQHNGIGFSFGKWSSYTNFQLQHSDGWQNTATEYTMGTETPILDSRNKTTNRHTNWQVAERLVYTPIKNVELYAEGSVYWKRIYRPCGKYAHYDVYTYDLEYHNSSAAIGGKWRLNKTDVITLDVDWNRHAYYYYFTANTLVEDYEKSKGTIYYPYFPYLPDQTELQSDQQRTMVNLKGIFKLPYGNQLSAGIEYRYDWLESPTRVAGGTVHDNNEAIYVQDEFDMINNLQITAGLRLNHNDEFGFRFTPKVSAMYRLGNPVRLRATWSQGFKTPTTKELYYRYVRQMNGTYLYLGNLDLTPQTSNYYSLGGEYTWNGLSVTLTGYYNQVKDMIALVTIPNYQAPEEYIVQYDPLKTRQYQNIEDAKTYGLDMSIQYAWKEVSVGLGYSYLDTKANSYDTNHERMHEVIIDGMAHHKANAFATWSHLFRQKYRLGIGIYGKMSTKRYYQINGNGKGYQIWRLATTHDFGKNKALNYRLEAGIDNIFNYRDTTPHGLHLGTTTPGTTLYATFSIRLAKGKKTNNKFNTNLNQRIYEEN